MFMKTLARQAVSGNKLYWQARALLLSAALFLAGGALLTFDSDPPADFHP